MMKTFFKLLVVALVVCGTWSCDDNDPVQPDPQLEATYANVAGTWQLTGWDGKEMNDDRFFYMTLIRRPNDDGWHLFEIYQNFDTAKTRHLTGIYELKEDEDLGDFITGWYDYTIGGFWTNDYLIYIEKDKMIWTVKDDASDVSVYMRVDSVPEDVVNGTRAE